MTMIQQSLSIDGVELTLTPDARHEYLMTTEQVAVGYGVTPENIRSHKLTKADELVGGKHWLAVGNTNAAGTVTFWTKRGIVRLGFFIRSARARKFRDLAEDLVIEKLEQPTAPALISAEQIGLSSGQTRNAAGKYVNSFGVHAVAYYHEDSRKQIVHLFNLAEVERVYAERQYPLRTPLVPHGGTVIQGQPPKAIKAAPLPNVKLPDRHFADAYRIGGDLGVKLLEQFLSEELAPRMRSALGLA